MDTQLEERLGRLGGSAQEPVGIVPTHEMWTRGRRRVHVRRVAGAVTTLALAAVLGSAALVATDVTRTEAVPVSAERGAVLPKELAFTVPESLPTLGPGEVSAVGTRQRDTGRLFWGGSVTEVVGVQATTGAYGVIDTPGLVSDGYIGDVALARRVASGVLGQRRLRGHRRDPGGGAEPRGRHQRPARRRR